MAAGILQPDAGLILRASECIGRIGWACGFFIGRDESVPQQVRRPAATNTGQDPRAPWRPWRFNFPFRNSRPFVLIRVSVFVFIMGSRVALAGRFIRTAVLQFRPLIRRAGRECGWNPSCCDGSAPAPVRVKRRGQRVPGERSVPLPDAELGAGFIAERPNAARGSWK